MDFLALWVLEIELLPPVELVKSDLLRLYKLNAGNLVLFSRLFDGMGYTLSSSQALLKHT